MKNEGLKQANALVNWFEINDIVVDDIIVTIKLKDNSMYKVMTDGSIVAISTDTNNNHAFQSASEAISAYELKKKPITKDEAVFKIKLPVERLKKSNHLDDTDLKSFFNDMALDEVKDNVAFLTYTGGKEEEPETIAVDIQRKYGVRPISIKRN